MTKLHPPSKPPFEEHLTSAFHDLRGALERLLISSGVDPGQPQDAARRLGVNRNLTWKLSKVLNGANLYESLQHLPGGEGLEILVRATQAAGAGDDVANEVRRAQGEFDRLVEIHTGDRATLDLILDNMGGATAERLEESRKLAFRGNSGMWGAQGRVRVTSYIVTPNVEQPSMVDTAMVGGIVDFRRLRPHVRWPLFRPRVYNAGGDVSAPEVAIDPAFADSSGPKFMSEFCQPMPPPLVSVPDGDSVVFELAEAPVGNTGAVTCYLGWSVTPTGMRYATAGDPVADLSSQLSMPAEYLLYDMFMHRDLADWGDPETFVVGQLLGSDRRMAPYRIPLAQKAEALPGQPPLLRCAQVPEYEDVMRYAFEKLRLSQRDFRVLRLLVKYPPMHATVVMRFKLPENPAGHS